MATVSVPQHAFFSQLLGAGTVLPKSSDMSFTLSFVGFECNFYVEGVQPNTANISAGWEVNVYRSTDNGSNYETVPSYSRVITRNPNVKDRASITVPAGQWAIRITSAGSAATTWSFYAGTADIITSVLNT